MVHTMNLAQYLQMWGWIHEWQHVNQTERLPRYVSIASFNIEGIDKIYKDTFMDMYHRVVKFQEANEGKMPEIIGIEGPAHGTEPLPPSGGVKGKLEAGLGSFNNFTEFWTKIIGRGYKHYYNSSYNLEEEIKRVINREGINCVDSMELCYSLAREMGYEARYVQVQCKEGGHIRGQIRGHEFGDWTRIDPAAALSTKSRYGIGHVWCDYPNAHIENGAWLRH